MSGRRTGTGRPIESVRDAAVAEAKSNADAVANVLTFDQTIGAVEIWHDEDGLETFVINGLSIPVGPGGSGARSPSGVGRRRQHRRRQPGQGVERHRLGVDRRHCRHLRRGCR